MREMKPEMFPHRPYMGFNEAAENVLEYLRNRINFDIWMVTRILEEDLVVLKTHENGYGIEMGQVFCWSDSFCIRMARGKGPQCAPCIDDAKEYLNAPVNKKLQVSSYMGVPLILSNGELFGTLCGLDPQVKPDSIKNELPMLRMMGRMLSTVISSELENQEIVRQLERAKAESDMDYLTDLYNRRGWDKCIDREEERCKRYGSPGAVIMIDLDNLKSVNDLQGHDAGDKLLQKTASTLKSVIKT